MSFLNTTFWEEFQKSVGRKTFRFRNDVYAVKMELPFNKSFLYSPSPNAPEFLDEIKKTAKQENAIFFKWEPMVPAEREIPIIKKQDTNKLQDSNFKKSNKALQPQKTVIVDLNKSEDVLMQSMHKKWRYNIRLAQRKGIEISECKNKTTEGFEQFWALLEATAEREGFATHPKEYYKELFKLEQVKLFHANFENKHPAFAVVLFHAKRATYLHGASDYKYRKYMAPHLLHAEIMRYAKEKQFSEYDLWGIDEKKWPGVTRFKRGFGGKEVEYIGSFDLPLQKLWYGLYRLKNIR